MFFEPLGHVALDDAAREALDDRRLADAGLADEHGVVLRAARQHLDDATDLVVAADDRIELALARHLGEIAAVPLERLELLLGVLARDAVATPHLAQRGQQLFPGAVEAVDHREQQVLGGQVLVVQVLALVSARSITWLSSRPSRDSPPYAFGRRPTASSARLRSISGARPSFWMIGSTMRVVLAEQRRRAGDRA